MGAVGNIVNQATQAGTASGTSALNSSTKDVTQQYNDLLKKMQGLYKPYLSAGKDALGQLSDVTAKGFDPSQFLNDPGYQFAMEQGLKATQNAAGVQGSPFGGAAQAEMSKFATGLANQTYNQAFSRWQTQVGNLQNLAGLGANVASSESGNMAQLLASLAGVSSGNAQTIAQTQAGQSDMF